MQRDGSYASVKLATLIERYSRVFGVAYDEASKRLPELPLEVKQATIEHELCRDCLPATLGTTENPYPGMLPAPQKKVLASPFSENLPQEERGKGTGKKKKRKSRSIKDRTRRDRINKIKHGGTDVLF
jgi:hypothetical protein